jgi:hypothetical protein
MRIAISWSSSSPTPGNKNDDVSWSRAVLRAIEDVLFGELPGE